MFLQKMSENTQIFPLLLGDYEGAFQADVVERTADLYGEASGLYDVLHLGVPQAQLVVGDGEGELTLFAWAQGNLVEPFTSNGGMNLRQMAERNCVKWPNEITSNGGIVVGFFDFQKNISIFAQTI